jgi:hypothetical protein
MIRLKRQTVWRQAEMEMSAEWPSRRISRRKVVNKGRTLKEKRCAHSNELFESFVCPTLVTGKNTDEKEAEPALSFSSLRESPHKVRKPVYDGKGSLK